MQYEKFSPSINHYGPHFYSHPIAFTEKKASDASKLLRRVTPWEIKIFRAYSTEVLYKSSPIIIIIIIIIITFSQYMKQVKNYKSHKNGLFKPGKKYINKLIKVDKYI